jgi:hypothetical protein
MSHGTFTVSSAPGFGRQPPENVPSSRRAPVGAGSMRTLSAILANVALFASIALVPVVGGAVLILFLFFPLFLLALLGVLAGLEHRTVRQ